MTQKYRALGFTLIELMVVVVIVGILAGIAYPSYSRYVTQARRTDAQNALMQVASQQEKYMTQCNYYAKNPTGSKACGAGAGAGDSVLGLSGDLSTDKHYKVTLLAGIVKPDGSTDPSCNTFGCGFTAVADPNGSGTTGRQANDGRFAINSRGEKFWDRNNDGDYADTGEDKWSK